MTGNCSIMKAFLQANIMLLLSAVFIRFLLFWLKVGLSCLFVMALQLEIGSKSLEQWFEQSLRRSAFGKHFQQTAQVGKTFLEDTFPQFKGIAQNKIIKRNAILEFHSEALNNAMQGIKNFDSQGEGIQMEEENRLPSGAELKEF